MDRRTYAIAVTAALAVVAGCGSGSGSAEKKNGETLSELRRYEETFRPSEFDPPPAAVLRQKGSLPGDSSMHAQELPAETPPEYVSGFRVQIFSSTDIDEANGVRTAAEGRFPAEWFYVVYDPPTYKVRAGDFQQRYDADRLARALREGGYSDSWIVPDRVVKNPPAKALPPEEKAGEQK